MKKLFKYIKSFLKEDFNLGLYISVLIFLGVSVHLNYIFEWEDQLEDALKHTPQIYPAYFLIYAVPYYVSCVLVRIFTGAKFFNNPQFWLRSLFALLLMTFDKCFYYHNAVYNASNPEIRLYYFRIVSNIRSIITVLIPLVLFYYLSKDFRNKNFYGLSTKSFDLKPYLVMLLFMVPLIYLASLTPDFTEYYPKYNGVKGRMAARYLEVPEWTLVLGFETAYSWDFVMVELLLRGFLVVGLIKVMGRHAIVPMAAVYCFYHFGKPVGEIYSSIFGGYIVGIFAYYTRSIWGGVFIHLAVALLMEFFAWIQHLFATTQ